MTNNEAEAAALYEAVLRYCELLDQGHPGIIPTVRIFGDSQLIIKWLLGLFKKIGKRSIY